MRESKRKTKKAARRARRSIDLELVPGEEVLYRALPWRGATWPKYLYTLGLYGFWRKRRPMVLTDHRVLLGKGVFVRTERSIPLHRVDNAVYVRVGPVSYCDVLYTTRGSRATERLGPFSPLKARQFANAINARI
jgi:hypothetical protein